MSMHTVFIHAISPIRVGTGQGAGIIDLPVVREKQTDWPYLPGTSIKGVLRDACEAAEVDKSEIRIVFGPKSEEATSEDAAGGVIFTDLQMLCLPVRCYRGSFLWVTSPLALARWQRDRGDASPIFLSVDNKEILLADDAARNTVAGGNTVQLEDLALTAKLEPWLDSFSKSIADACFAADWSTFFCNRFGVVSDQTFTYLTRTAMEVTARTSIDDESKTVKGTALWWEEAVPAESIFVGRLEPTKQGLTGYDGDEEKLMDVIHRGIKKTVQIGGNATVGRGIARMHFGAPLAAEVQG